MFCCVDMPSSQSLFFILLLKEHDSLKFENLVLLLLMTHETIKLTSEMSVIQHKEYQKIEKVCLSIMLRIHFSVPIFLYVNIQEGWLVTIYIVDDSLRF